VTDRSDIERAIAAWREPVRMNSALDARVMAEVARVPAPRPEPAWRKASRWLVRGSAVRLSPVTALAAAAGLVLVTLVGQQWLQPAAPAVPTALTTPAAPAVQFVVVIPEAGAVSLVGDFNDWDERATPMRPVAGDGVWSVMVPLAPGRYRYSFLVDGMTWLPDPAAPRGLEDDFGRPNSVVTVGGI
jgi:hypothetical protein